MTVNESSKQLLLIYFFFFEMNSLIDVPVCTGNRIKCQGMKALAPSLYEMKHLTQLELGGE